MLIYKIKGGKKLNGSVGVQTSKNAVLPLFAASLLTEKEVVLQNCPMISDVFNMAEILKYTGAQVKRQGKAIVINSEGADKYEIPEIQAKTMRSSIFMLGAVISRFKQAKIYYPGGCVIGERPINLHITGLKALGVKFSEEKGMLSCVADNLKGADIKLDIPSVGATENIMLAAACAEGQTVIRNCANEPEITDLQNFINKLGGKITGAGTGTVYIEGVKRLSGAEYNPIPDRIVAGTYLTAVAAAGGAAEIKNCVYEHVAEIVNKLRQSACNIDIKNDIIYIKANKRLKSPGSIETMPYPGFPTDMQAQIMAALAASEGTAVIYENLFETRFNQVPELNKMGADITVKGNAAVIRGVKRLDGADLNAHDLRCGAALAIAAFCADGESIIRNIHHIERGYEGFEENFRLLGAEINKVES